MNRPVLALAFLLCLGAATAQAQVHIQIDLGLPVAPPLVLIQPGIQVVESFGEEVFFHNGWYWCRRHDGWYRARSPRARFAWVEERRVPRRLVVVPRAHYRNWHHGRDRFHHERELRREERREDKRERKEEHRMRKEEQREERRDRKEGRREDRRRDDDHRPRES